MNVIDSSGWLEYSADGPSAGLFASTIEKTDQLIVPTLSLYEVFKRVLQQRDEGAALNAVALMQQATVVDLSASLADSVIYATARAYEATLWTQDADFKGLPHVRFRAVSPRK